MPRAFVTVSYLPGAPHMAMCRFLEAAESACMVVKRDDLAEDENRFSIPVTILDGDGETMKVRTLCDERHEAVLPAHAVTG